MIFNAQWPKDQLMDMDQCPNFGINFLVINMFHYVFDFMGS